MSSRVATAGLFLLLAAVWGTSFVAARAALADVPPVLLAAFRFDVAALLVMAYAVVTTSDWIPSRRVDWCSVALGGLLFVALHHALLFTGQQYVTSAVAAVLVSLDPVLATAFARAALPRERLSRTGGIALFVGLLGVVIVAGPAPDALRRSDIVGSFFVVLAAAAFALGSVTTRRLRTDLPVQTLQAWMLFVGALLLHALAGVVPGERLAAVTWSRSAVLGLGYLAVVAAGVGYFIYFELLDRLGPVEVNFVAYVTPVFAALGGWIALGEAIRWRTVAGFALIACAFVLLKRTALAAELDGRRR